VKYNNTTKEYKKLVYKCICVWALHMNIINYVLRENIPMD